MEGGETEASSAYHTCLASEGGVKTVDERDCGKGIHRHCKGVSLCCTSFRIECNVIDKQHCGFLVGVN